MTREIAVLAYDINWPQKFNQEQALLQQTLGDNAVTIHHIGSTAVAGLSAKPVIDILIVVKNLVQVLNSVLELQALGYLSKGEHGIVGRLYFQKGVVQRSHHVHIFEQGHELINLHLLFRDYLRRNISVAKQYEKLKLKLAKEYSHSPQAYNNGKQPFIERHLLKATGKSSYQ